MPFGPIEEPEKVNVGRAQGIETVIELVAVSVQPEPSVVTKEML
jgi:hypothetical protein